VTTKEKLNRYSEQLYKLRQGQIQVVLRYWEDKYSAHVRLDSYEVKK